jgi:catechol 2,3-dioxygenase-like lactoylglutathione lyase family enzyme
VAEAGARASLTHIALRAKDVDASVAFYRRYAGLHVVHDRTDDETRVVWLAEVEKDPEFVIVVMGMPADEQQPVRPVDHLGFSVPSRAEVDRLGALAEQDGALVLAPVEYGPIVGYICEVADPDGNVCEFSHGQPINPRHLPRD